MTGAQIEGRACEVRAWLESESGRSECSRLVAKYGASDGYLIMHGIRRTGTEGRYEKYEEIVEIVNAVRRQRMAETVARRGMVCTNASRA
jgi:hypothetical protein